MSLRNDPKTTVAGAALGFGGIVLALIPDHVRDGCINAISSSDNPAVLSIMVLAGLILTVIGPSLQKKNAKADSEDSDPSTPSS